MIDFLKYCSQIFNKETDWEENNYYSTICAASQSKTNFYTNYEIILCYFF